MALVVVVVAVAVVQEVDMAEVIRLAMWQPHPLKILGSSHPWVVNEILLVSPLSSLRFIHLGTVISLETILSGKLSRLSTRKLKLFLILCLF